MHASVGRRKFAFNNINCDGRIIFIITEVVWLMCRVLDLLSGVLTIWMEFSVDFFAQMELHFFSPRKRNENKPYHLILIMQMEQE